MNKKIIWLLGTIFLTAAPSTDVQLQTKIPKIGWLGGRSPGGPGSGGESFRLALRARGYVEGKTVTIEYRLRRGQARPTARSRPGAGPSQRRLDHRADHGGSPRRESCDQDDSDRFL